jgi:hypothetical protein
MRARQVWSSLRLVFWFEIAALSVGERAIFGVARLSF